MGLDLTLLPFEADYGDWGFSHSVLNLERRGELLDEILELRAHPVPLNFGTFLCRDDAYEEPHYGNTQETPYGEPLQWVRVTSLRDLSERRGVIDNCQNRAVWAYLKELPNDAKVALYWS